MNGFDRRAIEHASEGSGISGSSRSGGGVTKPLTPAQLAKKEAVESAEKEKEKEISNIKEKLMPLFHVPSLESIEQKKRNGYVLMDLKVEHSDNESSSHLNAVAKISFWKLNDSAVSSSESRMIFKLPVYSSKNGTELFPFLKPNATTTDVPPYLKKISDSLKRGWLQIFTALHKITDWKHNVSEIEDSIDQDNEICTFSTVIESKRSVMLYGATSKKIEIKSELFGNTISFSLLKYSKKENVTGSYFIADVDSLIESLRAYYDSNLSLHARYNAQIQRLTAVLEERQRSADNV